ncbi:nucleoporin Nup186/Nup192/Nup205 [Sporodiniella umbellata]|nr:nucleoporin Nup186/Nup192/Nup205 [Sporodiniella umbellata]
MQSTKAADLRTLLNAVCEARRAPSQAAVRLESFLQDHKQTLINLLDNPPKNSEHRTNVQNGKVLIDDQEYKTNKEFTREAIFLSDQLNLEEYECSRLLLEGTRQSRTTFSSALDTAVYLYHAERGYVLSILNTIFESIKDEKVDKHIRSAFLDYMAAICLRDDKGFISKILKSLDDLNNSIKLIVENGSQQTQLQQTQPQQILPQQPQAQLAEEPKLTEDTMELRIELLKEERISLTQLLYHASSFFWLSEADILSLLALVQKTNLLDPISPYLLTVVLSAISPQWLDDNQNHLGVDISTQDESMKKIDNIIKKKEWKVDCVKGVVLLQWSLFNIKKSSLSDRGTFKLDEQETTAMAKEGIDLDAFGFLNEYLLHFKQKDGNIRPVTNRVKENSESIMVIDGLTVDPNNYKKFYAGISNDFRSAVEHEMDILTENFILKMSSLLHQLKTTEEDSIYQVEYPTKVDSGYIKEEERESKHLEKFLTLLATVYRNRCNAGGKFWTRKDGLFAFIKWTLDIKVVGTIRAAFDVLASISTGDQCASHAYEVLSMGTVRPDINSSHLFSWGKLFGSLQFYSNGIQKTWPDNECPSIPESEEEVLCKLIHLCEQVIQYSSTARAEIWNDDLFKAHESIIKMIGSPTSVSLRTQLYSLLTAFCSSWGGGINGIGRTISFQVWNSLDGSDFISANRSLPKKNVLLPADISKQNFLSSLSNPSSATIPVPVTTVEPVPTMRIMCPDQSSGFLLQFNAEKNEKSYSKTLSMLQLIASIIHKQSEKDALISGFSATEQSIPPFLGSDHRSPGASPYLSLVIDHIFLNMSSLQFSNPDGKWQLTDACLKVIENSIMSFNLEEINDYIIDLVKNTDDVTLDTNSFLSFLRSTNSSSSRAHRSKDISSMLLPYVLHPGFDILVRILSGSSLVVEMFKIICTGREEISESTKSKGKKSFYLQRSLTRCLRIVHKAMSTQNVFANLFIPQLALCSEKLPAGEFKLLGCAFPEVPSALASVGKHMLFRTKVISQIALLVNAEEHEEISALSVAILSILATEPEANPENLCFPDHVNIPMGGLGTQLPTILLASNESVSIILGFSERLEIESTESISYDNYKYDINTIPFWLAEKTLGPDHNQEEEDVAKIVYRSPSTRIAILDMLIACTKHDKKSPNLAEFILGYDISDIASKGAQHKSIPTSFDQNPQPTCFFTILNMLRASDDQEFQAENTFSVRVHPLLADKCYQLLYQLCCKESTSTATTYYLRTSGDDFLINRLKAISPRIEDHLFELEPCFSGMVQCATKEDVQTDFITLRSTLNQRAWLLKLITLELHIRKTTGTAPLLNLLYGYKHSSGGGSLNSEASLNDLMRSMHLQMNADYQQPKWNLLELITSLDFVWIDSQLNLNPVELNYYKSFEAEKYKCNGSELFDIRSVYKFLRRTQIDLFEALTKEENTALEEEMGKILQSLTAQNRAIELRSSRLHCIKTWEQLIEITLFDCLDSFTADIRQKIINDVISMLQTKLEEENLLGRELLETLNQVVHAIANQTKTQSLSVKE